MVEEQTPRTGGCFGVGDHPVIDERLPVADGFEASATPPPSRSLRGDQVRRFRRS